MNDWIVAGINNPNFSIADFANIADMTTDNTQLLSVDDYLKSDFIRNNDYFKDENGQFSESIFRNYYASRAADFNTFAQDEFYSGPSLDLFDLDRSTETPVLDNYFNVTRGFNPDRQQIGIEGVNIWSNPTLSQREIAKQNKIYNTEKEQFEEYSVNDHTLVSNAVEWVKDLFKNPLVLAVWDEDGTHIDPMTGTVQQHMKGQAKLNDKGTYYYETLGDRSVLGKDVLSVFDTLTIDGVGANKYDFFDSNDIKKSVGGVVMKNLFSLLPLFVPVLREIYPAMMIAKGLAQSAPMMAGMVTGLLGTETPKWSDSLGLWASRFSMSTSDWAKEHMFATENIANMISDVALQWGQQMSIAKGFGRLRGSQKYIDEAMANAKALYEVQSKKLGESQELWNVCLNRFMPHAQEMAQRSGQLGRDLALVYMAVISNQDVFEDMINRGASKKEAAIVTLGSTVGMFGVDKYLHLGEIFYDDATLDSVKQARRTLRKEFRDAQKALSDVWKNSPTERHGLLRLFDKARNISEKTLTKFSDDLKNHTLSMTGKMFGEGIEEVAEEIVTDISKGLYEAAGALGANTSVKDIGAFDNVGERYFMNFLGGFIGGGIFYGKEVWDRGTFAYPKVDEDIATLIRNGYGDELRKQVAKMYDEGKTGNKKLSATEHTFDKDLNPVFYTVTDQTKSQGKLVADLVLQKIDAIERSLNENRMNLSDDDLFQNMVLSERRYQRYMSIAPVTNYFNDAAAKIQNVINAETDYKKSLNSIDGTPGGTPISYDVTETVKKHLPDDVKRGIEDNENSAKQKYLDAKKDLDDFLSGDGSLRYTRMLSFALDRELSEPFFSLDKNAKAQEWYHTDLNKLDATQLVEFNVKWYEYVNGELKVQLPEAFKRFEEFSAKVYDHLDKGVVVSDDYIEWSKNLDRLFASGILLPSVYERRHLTMDSRLPGETDMSYEHRNKKYDILPDTGEPETDEQFRRRMDERRAIVKERNDAVDKEWADAVRAELEKVGGVVDPSVARMIIAITEEKGRTRGIINRVLDAVGADKVLRSAFSKLDPTLKNTPEVLADLKKLVRLKVISDYNAKLSRISNRSYYDKDGNAIDINRMYDLLFGEEDSGEGFYSVKEAYDMLKASDLAIEEAERKIEEAGEDEKEDAKKELEKIKEADLFSKLSDADNEFLRNEIYSIYDDENISREAFDDTDLIDMGSLFTSGTSAETMSAKGYLDKALNDNEAYYTNQAERVISDIKSNPIYGLREYMKKDVKNPLTAVLDSIAESDPDHVYLPERSIEVLDEIASDYDNINDIIDFHIDDAQYDRLQSIKGFLEMFKLAIRAASTVPDIVNPIGHNKSINDFARKNASKLNRPWKELYELGTDKAALFYELAEELRSEIDNWIRISNKMLFDKTGAVKAVDPAMARMQFSILKGINPTFKIGGKEYDLLAGIDSIDESLVSTDQVLKPLADLELLITRNIDRIAVENNTTIDSLFINDGLSDNLLPGFEENRRQENAILDKNIDKKEPSIYTKIIYFATLLALPPGKYYSDLLKSVGESTDMVPIGPQEYASRIAQAAITPIFRNILDYVYARSNYDMAYLPNTVIISGTAGTGKTQFVLQSVYKSLKKKNVLLSGPKQQQIDNLEKVFGAKKGISMDDLLDKAIGNEQWKKINSDFMRKETNEAYSYSTSEENGVVNISLNPDKIEFKELGPSEDYEAIFIDEATHLSTLAVEILAEWCKRNGIELYLCGDFLQNGNRTIIDYEEKGSVISNIGVVDAFAARTPELTLSMRTANMQIDSNNKKLEAILRTVNELYDYGSAEEFNRYVDTLLDLMRKTSLSYYLQDDLNGDLIVKDIDENVIRILKDLQERNKTLEDGKKKTFAFLGSSSSPYLAKLRERGIVFDSVLQMTEMQGQEFDYAVIDEKYETSVKSTGNVMDDVLRKFYTLKTRAREGNIIIDNGLSSYFGDNVESFNKSMAPSIMSAFDELKTNRLNILGMISVNDSDMAYKSEDNRIAVKDEEEVEDEESEMSTDSDDVKKDDSAVTTEIADDPETDHGEIVSKHKDLTTDIIYKLLGTDPPDTDPSGDMISDEVSRIYSFGDVMPLDAQIGDETSYTYKTGDGAERTVKAVPWIIKYNEKSGTRRNLQALTETNNKELTTRKQKLSYQDRLAKVRSALKFGHSFSELREKDAFIAENFNEKDWENGTYELEFRYVDTKNDIRAIGSGMDHGGIDIGRGMRIYANIVFSVKNNKGVTCRFDLAGMNDPKTLSEKAPVIKENLNKRIERLKKEGADKKEIDKLQAQRDGLDKKIADYTDWFNGKVNELKKIKGDRTLNYDITEVVNPNRKTWFTKRSGPSKDVRLDGWTDLDKKGAVDYDASREAGKKILLDPYDTNSFKARNPEFKMSKVYICGAMKGSSEMELLGLSPSLAGKAVVFVTSDKLLDEGELINKYIEQKRNPSKNDPVVRMIVLNNYGLSFGQIMSDSFFSGESESSSKYNKPLRQNWVGIRMFASLWNARAALKLFNNAKRSWMEKYGLDDSKVGTLLYAYDLKTNGLETDDKINKILRSAGLDPKTAFGMVEEFNNVTCLDIPMFRLAYYRNEKKGGGEANKLGFHIQGYDVKGSRMYSVKEGEKVNMCAIDPETAVKYEEMLDIILNQLCNQSAHRKRKGLELGLYKYKDGKKTIYGEEEFINASSEHAIRSLKGMISDLFKEGKTKITVTEEDSDGTKKTKERTVYIKGDFWSYIPRTLASICKKVYALQRNTASNTADKRNVQFDYVITSFSKGEATGEKTGKIRIELDELLNPDNGLLMMNPDGSVDNSLLNMLNMIFHGTTDNFQQKFDGEGKLRSIPQMYDAYFKYGFLINPKVNVEETVHLDGKEGNAVFYGVKTPAQFFGVDVNMRSAGYELNFEDLKKIKRASEKSIGNREVSRPAVAAIDPKEQIGKIKGYLLDEKSDSIDIDGLDLVDTAMIYGIKKDFKEGVNIFKGFYGKKIKLGGGTVEAGIESIICQALQDVDKNIDEVSISADSGLLIIKYDGNEYVYVKGKSGMTFGMLAKEIGKARLGKKSSYVESAVAGPESDVLGNEIEEKSGRNLKELTEDFFDGSYGTALKRMFGEEEINRLRAEMNDVMNCDRNVPEQLERIREFQDMLRNSDKSSSDVSERIYAAARKNMIFYNVEYYKKMTEC